MIMICAAQSLRMSVKKEFTESGIEGILAKFPPPKLLNILNVYNRDFGGLLVLSFCAVGVYSVLTGFT